jgi:hypothetical protein
VRRTLAIAVLCLCAAAPVGAQVNGALSSARVLPENTRLAAAYVHFGGQETGASGQLRMSLHRNLDFGFQGGLGQFDDETDGVKRTTVRLGIDMRGQIATQGRSFPVTVAIGGTLGMESIDDKAEMALGPQMIASFGLDNTESVAAYAGVAMLMARRVSDAGDRNDVVIPVRLGVEFHPSPHLRLVGEVQNPLSDEARKGRQFTIGALFPF